MDSYHPKTVTLDPSPACVGTGSTWIFIGNSTSFFSLGHFLTTRIPDFFHASMNTTLLGWCLGRGCYVCTLPAARASANRHSTALAYKALRGKKKSTTFFTPLGLVLGDYLALLIYCVIIKLRYLDISSTSTMWLERERESNALNVFLADNFLRSIEWQKGETSKQYSTDFVLIHSLKGGSIKSDSYRNLYNCHLKFHLLPRCSW